MLEEPETAALWRSRAGEVAGATLGTAPIAVFVDARLAVHSGQFDDAESLVRKAFAINAPLDPYLATRGRPARSWPWRHGCPTRLPDTADLLAAAAPLAEENTWATACLARARDACRKIAPS
jgi:hypothetical protein